MTRQSRPVQDLLALVVPELFTVDDPRLPALLARQAIETVWTQWEHSPARPVDVQLTIQDWLVTGDVAKIRAFRPAHDCDECRRGPERGVAFLEANPGRMMAIANLVYVEVWP